MGDVQDENKQPTPQDKMLTSYFSDNEDVLNMYVYVHMYVPHQ